MSKMKFYLCKGACVTEKLMSRACLIALLNLKINQDTISPFLLTGKFFKYLDPHIRENTFISSTFLESVLQILGITCM